ncbi:DUF418 domain-containing protein [Streptomyces massasporeus]|uniref:DUF418 domain-containing protein n=1 Tax=Streptomyces massasporeus TaxID=67324 RepID=UPI00378EE3A0
MGPPGCPREREENGRIQSVDVLRGFALLGILLVNAPVLAGVHGVGDGPQTAGDRIAVWLVTVLAQSKFYLLFSFLFGYSFTQQVRAAEREGAAFTPRYCRRLLGLFLIGVGHAILLYPGDILTTYAVLGLVLPAFRRADARTVLRVAAMLLIWLTLVFLVIGLIMLGAPRDAGFVPAAAAPYTGGPADVVTANLQAALAAAKSSPLYMGHLLAAFLAGVAAGKKEILTRAEAHVGQLRRIAVAGTLVGLPGSLVMALCELGPWEGRFTYLGRAVAILTAPALTAAYAGAVLLFLMTGRRPRLRRALASAGRLALTNYLVQSAILAWVFTGYGLVLYGRVGPAPLALGCLLLFILQVSLSTVVVSSGRRGPAELLLRRIITAGRGRGHRSAAEWSGDVCPGCCPGRR